MSQIPYTLHEEQPGSVAPLKSQEQEVQIKKVLIIGAGVIGSFNAARLFVDWHICQM